MRSRLEINRFLKEQCRINIGPVERAIAFATFAHDGQVDKAGEMYIRHPMRVGDALKAAYPDKEFLCEAGYLHDVVEDGNVTVSDLSAFFEERVWKLVEMLTRSKNVDRQVYISRISTDYWATTVKLEDLRDNMNIKRISNPTEKDIARQERYYTEFRLLTNSRDSMRPPEDMQEYE